MSQDSLLRLDWNGAAITRRRSDDYVNLSALVRAHNSATGQKRKIQAWYRTNDAKEFLDALSADTGQPVGVATPLARAEQATFVACGKPALIEVCHGHETWGHPDAAVELAGWLSKPLRVAINRWFRQEVERQQQTPASAPAPVATQQSFGFAEQILEALEKRKQGNKGISSMAAASGLAFHQAHNAGNVELTGHPAKHWREVSGHDNWQQHADWPWQSVKGLAGVGSMAMVEQLAPGQRDAQSVRACIEFSHAKAREFAEAVGLSPQPRFLPRRLTERRVRGLVAPAAEREQLALLA